MSDSSDAFVKLLKEDPRYPVEAYIFVSESLEYAHRVLGLGGEPSGEPSVADEAEEEEQTRAERHVTGQQLCEAIRLFALEQYGYMAKCVLNNWGLTRTADFGEIVFNLISIGRMSKTDDDRKEDFEDVFEFETGLRESFRITISESE